MGETSDDMYKEIELEGTTINFFDKLELSHDEDTKQIKKNLAVSLNKTGSLKKRIGKALKNMGKLLIEKKTKLIKVI